MAQNKIKYGCAYVSVLLLLLLAGCRESEHPAEKIYADFHKACLQGDVEAASSYLTGKALAQFQTTQAEKDGFSRILKMNTAKEYEIVQIKADSKSATFHVTGKQEMQKEKLNVHMLIVEDTWKISSVE